MVLENNIEIGKNAVINNLKRITNQIYKLLPTREENMDWNSPLKTIIEEISGMSRILIKHQENIFSLLCKLEGLFNFNKEEDFFEYRRTIFDCLNLISTLREEIEQCQD